MKSILLSLILLSMAATLPAQSNSSPLFARLSEGDTTNLQAIQQAFAERNPGYSLDYWAGVEQVPAQAHQQVVFLQEGETSIHLDSGEKSEVSVGDIVMLTAEVGFQADSAVSVLVFQVPDSPPENIPAVIRPDWDPNITDVPGGCATETGAYRRILLTWMDKVGPYLFHSINAHRVRIMDSFSHYHPVHGGFDEFYLVQMALPEAGLLTSTQVPVIEQPDQVKKKQAKTLIQHQPLEVGDLIYLPRGVMHRGIGGVLAQVITVPGFVPGSEIGVDHHLRKINERLKLSKRKALPYNEVASDGPVIK
ncbi:MAG: hypothetical protein AAF399_13755 [Bacteroidota bacterium]